MPLKSIPLSDGYAIPWIAFGTGTALYQKDCTDIVARAVALGFTHLDGAQMYDNEDTLGAGIAASKAGRGTLYVTTKLTAIPEGSTVEDSLRESLRKLRLEHVDLFLIHSPSQHAKREGGVKQVWREMVGVKEKGLAKSIGVSNFNKAQLEEIISLGLEKPVVNQIEYHLLVAKRLAPLLEYSRAQGIVTESYGGLTPILPSRAGDAELASVRAEIASTLNKLADARGVTQNQVLLKWLQAEGVVAVTTSSKESRLKEYLAVESIADLTRDEKKELEDAVGGKHYREFSYFFTEDD